MDVQETRMQCLKLAMELSGKPEAVLSAAEQLLNFVTGGKPSAADLTTQSTPAAEPEAVEATPEPQIVDAIAACGTVLAIPDGGGLADAAVTIDAPAEAAESLTPAETPVVELAAPVVDEPAVAAAAVDPVVDEIHVDVSAEATSTEAITAAEPAAVTTPTVDHDVSAEVHEATGEEDAASMAVAADPHPEVQLATEPSTSDVIEREPADEAVPAHVAANEGEAASEAPSTHH